MAAKLHRLVGTWRIVETDLWDRQFLDLCGPAFIEVDAHGHGNMAFGAMQASIDCRFTSNGIAFHWNGADEGDQVCGDGGADIRDDGRIEGEIAYRNGDEATFEAVPWVRSGTVDQLTAARRR